MNTLTPEQKLQQRSNIDRLRVIYNKVKREAYLSKIFEYGDKAKELNFDDMQGEH